MKKIADSERIVLLKNRLKQKNKLNEDIQLEENISNQHNHEFKKKKKTLIDKVK